MRAIRQSIFSATDRPRPSDRQMQKRTDGAAARVALPDAFASTASVVVCVRLRLHVTFAFRRPTAFGPRGSFVDRIGEEGSKEHSAALN